MVPTGHFTTPIFDGGIGELKGAFYKLYVFGDKIGTQWYIPIGGDPGIEGQDNSNITCYHGIDGSLPISTLGVVATPNAIINFGDTGLQGNRIQMKYQFKGRSTDTFVDNGGPIFYSAILNYLKDPDKRQTYEFSIDLKKTARDNGGKALEAIIGTLDAITNTKTLVPFYYGQIGTKYVKVIDMPAQENVKEDSIMPAERDGFIRLKLSEIL